MILVDTSIWVEFFRSSSSPQSLRLRQVILSQDVMIGDLIFAELLQGVKTAAEARQVASQMSTISIEPLCGYDIALRSASNYRLLRSRGLTIRGTIDVIIAAWCIENRVPLLHNDRDFAIMETELGLPSYTA